MMLAKKLQSATAAKQYVDDVFSTYLYTGSESARTINNGIDLAGKGGLVWIKSRLNTTGISSDFNHALVDTIRGAGYTLRSNDTQASAFQSTLSSFTSSGFNFSASTQNWNRFPDQYASWTFRRAPKFFDVVTWTGDGAASRAIPHGLNCVVGTIFVKQLNGTGAWKVWHRSLAAGKLLGLNATFAEQTQGYFPSQPTDSVFYVSATPGAAANALGGTYVAYLWAHDPSEDGIVQCGSYVGTGAAQQITLEWEPQFVIIKRASEGTSDWNMVDSMRGFVVGGGDGWLRANTSGAESSADLFDPTATGFNMTAISSDFNASGSTYIYLAIRRPNKPPASGTEVYNAIAYAGDGDVNRFISTGIPVDFLLVPKRSGSGSITRFVSDRLTQSMRQTVLTDADTTGKLKFDSNTGIRLGNGVSTDVNDSSSNSILEAFRRAPRFFDVVCYTGTGVARTVPHGLGVAPELMIVKSRNQGASWIVTSSFYASHTHNYQVLNLDYGVQVGANWFVEPTKSTFGYGAGDPDNTAFNRSGNTFVAYLFATLPGISKVGSYTGNGSTQTINCGFATGARFILIKRTDDNGDWYVWDSARGIVSTNDPHLSLNTTAAEVTTDDSVDPDNSGFIVNQVTATNININSASYIYLTIS